MMDMGNLDILEMLPKFMKEDELTQKHSKVFNIAIKLLYKKAQECMIYQRIDELDHDLLDELAWQFHVDFYDPNMEIEKKRELVKHSPEIHMIKGTPRAVEILLEAAFSESWVKEWFQYGGDPYTFKVKTTDRITSMQSIADLRSAIDTVKNERSHLTHFEVLRQNRSTTYMTTTVRRLRRIRV